MIPKGFCFVTEVVVHRTHFQKHLAKSFQMFCLNVAQHGQYYARHKESMFVLAGVFVWISWNGTKENMKYEKIVNRKCTFLWCFITFLPLQRIEFIQFYYRLLSNCAKITQHFSCTTDKRNSFFSRNFALKFGESSEHTHFDHFSWQNLRKKKKITRNIASSA